MKFSLTTIALLCSIVGLVSGQLENNFPRMDIRVAYGLGLDFSVNNKPRFVKRDGYAAAELIHEEYYYFAEFEIGSDKQKFQALIDTGSLDLWVVGKKAVCMVGPNTPSDDDSNEKLLSPKFEEKAAEGSHDSHYTVFVHTSSHSVYTYSVETTSTCDIYGSFATDTSDTFKKNETAPQFVIGYADGAQAVGFYGYDTVTIGNITVNDLSFAIANVTSSDAPVFGIGFVENESSYFLNLTNQTYENLPAKMKSSGLIEKNAYSLYLNNIDEESGLVLFGAVDHAKYNGTLYTVPIVYDPSDSAAFEVVASGINFISGDTSTVVTNNSYSALLDSGTFMTHLPSVLLASFAYQLNATYSESLGNYLVPCTNSEDAFLEIDFSGAKLKVPYRELLMHYEDDICILGLSISDDTSSSLGDGSSDSGSGSKSVDTSNILVGQNWLRSFYVVYDLEDKEISLAQAVYTDEEDIEKISSDGVPSAVKAPGYSQTSYDNSASLPTPTAFISNPVGTPDVVTASLSAGATPAHTTESFTGAAPSGSSGSSNSSETSSGTSTKTSSSKSKGFGAKTQTGSFIALLALAVGLAL